MLTKLGKSLRRLRIDRGLLLKDMADDLGFTSAYLSSIENGKRKPSLDLVDKVIEKYMLSDDEVAEIMDSYHLTLQTINIDTTYATSNQAELGLVFARSINSLSEDQIRKIHDILKKT